MVKTTVGSAKNDKLHKSRNKRPEVETRDDRKAKKTKINPVASKESKSLDIGESEVNSEENLHVTQDVNSLPTNNKPDESEPREETLATTFKPPPGFQPFELKEVPNSPDFLSKSNLQGKQIWYITAPISLEVSSLKDLTLAALTTGTPLVEFDGDEFGFFPESADKHNFPKVLTPTASKNGYSFVPEPITQILQLQRIVNLPSTSGSQVDTNNATVKTPSYRLPRAQPKGLRMRFHPIGCRSENPVIIGMESSSEESCPEPDDEILGIKSDAKLYSTGPDLKETARNKTSDKPYIKETRVPPPMRKVSSTVRLDEVSKINLSQKLPREVDEKSMTKKSKFKSHNSKG
ncbi:BgTH12-02652 [Blumeria graminis f. sp. triticale]|uniref:Bgt-1189 n=3 Tax=Blumeria graminis TaxID=34373 RepID=A0A9X9MI17_BLUGR|nr:hypothetical protein BGT96224_1189 [Blumeria graminis f. sp. tritici 96224]CAD6502978.1 BgTH12-02652 [Blumeria graminis f. sp. triticale]VDB88884.1 Bgt-1189 [Blumeria graminis f. sp. tritici]